MAKARTAVVVGIPGVGKTTVVKQVLTQLAMKGVKAKLVVFGTLMLKEARKIGVKHRDELRRLPIEAQRSLQVKAAFAIAKMRADLLVVDTHLFIKTREGFWPGLPADVLKALSPSNLILVEASPTEVLQRRSKDRSRYRDKASEDDIPKELQLAREMLGAAGILTGAPVLIVPNSEGRSRDAAQRIVSALSVA